MGWTKKNELNIVEFVEGKPEEFNFIQVKELVTKDGKKYEIMQVLNSQGVPEDYFLSGHLKYLIKSNNIQEGDKIRVTYKGLSPEPVKTEHGMKHVNQYELDVWED